MPASSLHGRRRALFAFFALLTVVVDQATKAFAVAYLAISPLPLLGGLLRLTVARNTGSAFGLPAPSWAITAVSLTACVVVLVWVARSSGLPPARVTALGLILGGAIGNLIDRIRMGAVVDFIDFRVWPVFNVADVALTIGVAVLMLEAIRHR